MYRTATLDGICRIAEADMDGDGRLVWVEDTDCPLVDQQVVNLPWLIIKKKQAAAIERAQRNVDLLNPERRK